MIHEVRTQMADSLARFCESVYETGGFITRIIVITDSMVMNFEQHVEATLREVILGSVLLSGHNGRCNLSVVGSD